MTPRLKRAHEYARISHGEQKRMYTGESYYESHLCEVSSLVAKYTLDEDMIIAALLHDVVEDTDKTVEEVRREFGFRVGMLVEQLTDISKPEDGNRAIRKALDRGHLAGAVDAAQTIKLADLISNTKSIAEHDTNFARVYIPEKEALLKVLHRGDPRLLALAEEAVTAAKEKLGI